MRNYLKFLPLIFLVIVPVIFFRQFFFQSKVPVPADALIGLYHPYRDLYAATNPNGIAYKNFLITDPVRQQYPWRYIAVDSEKNFRFPSWNPYNGAGEPLFGNIQSAAMYPLNLLLLAMPFGFGWSVLIFLQLLLGGIFMYLYLKNRDLTDEASLFGSVSYIFSGFWVAWLTWNTLLHVALWLPLALLSIDKIAGEPKKNAGIFFWSIVLIVSMTASFLAGHLQTYFYMSLLVTVYAAFRIFPLKKRLEKIVLLLGIIVNVAVLISVQFLATMQLIVLSARDTDQQFLINKEGWFIPWQHLIQFIVPDFFGNPATLNYWGTWNYGEMVGYIGLIPLFFVFYALLSRRSKSVIFFAAVTAFALLFSLPTIFAKIPFLLKVPLLSTSQPTRLMILIDFSLCILAAYGFDSYMRSKKFDRRIIFLLGGFALAIAGLWVYVTLAIPGAGAETVAGLSVAKRNLLLPTILLIVLCAILTAGVFINHKKAIYLCAVLLLLITTADLLRFSSKFNPFVNPEYLFPPTKTTTYLKQKSKTYPWRFLAVDYAANQKRILPPNVTAYYKIYTLDTYNPLLLRSFQNYAAASEFGIVKGNSVSFNRIIALNKYDSRLVDLAGVKYIASLADITHPGYSLRLRERETRIYENNNAFPRAFMVYDYLVEKNADTTASLLLDKKINLRRTAILDQKPPFEATKEVRSSNVVIEKYEENTVSIRVTTQTEGILLLTDTFYPTWKVKIDGKKARLLRGDLTFRGVVVPKGTHQIVFYTSIF
jgi:hypothetical protein